jgi:hypothetical protein
MTTNIPGDLRINGRDETLTSTIKTPLGFKTEIEGTVNIVNRSSDTLEPNDVARLQINGKTIHDARSVRNVSTSSGDIQILSTDDIVVSTDSGSGNLMMELPRIETVHPKTYTLQYNHVASDTNRSVNPRTTGISLASQKDNFDGKPWKFVNQYQFHQPGSITIQSELGTYPGQGSTNNWRIVSSHNQSDINGTYHREVKINAGIDGDQTLTDLVVGYSLNGYTLALGDRILLDRQTDPIENGVYIVNDTDPPHRAHDLGEDTYFTQSVIHSTENKKEFRILTEGKVDTDAINVLQTKGHVRVDDTQATLGAAFDADGDYGVLTTVSLTTGDGSLQPFTFNNAQYDPTTVIPKLWVCNYTGSGNPVLTIFDSTGSGYIDFKIQNVHTTLHLNAPVQIAYELIHTDV